MPTTIQHTVEFEGIAPDDLFEMYVTADEHARVIGAPVSISRHTGATFTAFGDGHVRGTNLLVVPGRMIVQSWRARVWEDSDPDSVLVLQFVRAPGGALVELIQAGVPEHATEIIETGWWSNYWLPWKEYLHQQGRAR